MSEKQIVLRPRGTFYHLQEIYDRMNLEYFDDRCSAGITWGKDVRKNQWTSIKLGSYHGTGGENLIRIHPALDNSRVPLYVMEWIVYHEMCHEFLRITGSKQRHAHHSPEFKRLERRYRHYRKASSWEKRNLEWLLGRRQLAFHIPAETT